MDFALAQINMPVPKQDVEHPTHLELEFFRPIMYPDLIHMHVHRICLKHVLLHHLICHIPYRRSTYAQIYLI